MLVFKPLRQDEITQEEHIDWKLSAQMPKYGVLRHLEVICLGLNLGFVTC